MSVLIGKNKKTMFYDYLYISLGCALLSLSINLFIEPNTMVTGGATGLGIIIQSLGWEYFNITVPLWLTNLVINIPLLIIAAKVKGGGFIAKTLYATLFLSFGLFVTAFIPTEYFPPDLFLAAVFGGVSSGAGLGIVFRRLATTGGSDLAAAIVHHYKRHISIATIMFVIDTSIIILGFFTFGAEKAMYAIIAVYISAKVIDLILEGVHFAKAAFIISDKSEAVAKRILAEMDRGATGLNGKGFYTGQPKNVILCVVSSKELVTLKELVREEDANAFLIVADVKEVLGEGFPSN